MTGTGGRVNRHRSFLDAAVPLGLLFVVGIAVAAISYDISSSNDDLAASIAKAGVTLALTTVGGAVAGLVLKNVDQRRARDQESRQVLQDIVDAYNCAKAVRRKVRAIGLLDGTGATPTTGQVELLRRAMDDLDGAQLRFEALKRQVRESDLFRHAAEIVEHLEAVEKYLNRTVLSRWEGVGGKLLVGPVARQDVDRLQLKAFVDDFPDRVSGRLDRITELLRAELFGPTRSAGAGGLT
jgi:hypothetical protein